MPYFFSFALIAGKSHPESLDADFNSDHPFVSITVPATRFRGLARWQKVPGQLVCRRKDHSRTTYLP